MDVVGRDEVGEFGGRQDGGMGVFDGAAEEPGAGVGAIEELQGLTDGPGGAGVLRWDLGGHGRLGVIGAGGAGHVGALMLVVK